jgi:putative membrane protein
MIRSYNDHAANERTFLAWLRTGLSAVTLGIVVKKGSLLAAIASASSPQLAGSVPDHLSSYAGPALVGLGVGAIAAAAIRFVRTACRIDDESVHSAGVVRLASAFLQRRPEDALTNDAPASSRKGTVLQRAQRLNVRLVGGTDDPRTTAAASQANHPVKS